MAGNSGAGADDHRRIASHHPRPRNAISEIHQIKMDFVYHVSVLGVRRERAATATAVGDK